ncbi:hypothetical protein CCACVL1_04903 [Corchorus capsularis]|uniref:Uncharacterized protein n=1 Tax=Corchorus capsularis TaxID=210143 RepID=A0A1R3JNZ9_COCAP|nr:hypothetical protein CCACVL1_04903 [Corchorus capsularis]
MALPMMTNTPATTMPPIPKPTRSNQQRVLSMWEPERPLARLNSS